MITFFNILKIYGIDSSKVRLIRHGNKEIPIHDTFLNDIQRLEKMQWLPTQLQNKIKGFNVRVHVVGQKTFATRIHTKATDYRYAYLDQENMQMQPYKLTETLNKMCIDLTKRLGLLFAGIDLMITDKKAYCRGCGSRNSRKTTGPP